MNLDNFDFASTSEEPEEFDYQKLTPCPWCKKPIPQDVTLCYYCGRQTNLSAKPLWVVWTAIALIVVFVIFLLVAV